MLSPDEKKSIREKFQDVPTGVISDAMDDLKLPNGVIGGLHQIVAYQRGAVGFAVTIQQRVLAPCESGAARHSQVIEEILSEGDVFVIDVGGCTDVCTGGEILVTRAKAKGAAGWIVNGALRDAGEIANLDFPVYLAGVSPRRSKGNLTTEGINVPVVISGKQIVPGMLIVFDETGIVAIPEDKIDAVYEQTQVILAKEAGIHSVLRAGKSLDEAKVVVRG